ncbi:hypothetical protein KZZ52_22690 [Dactylosporangium sp. AC04546]|uniref:hypothetical protein n=1 Tax=Dactylosporangium sp. AC04546 TaxID=2862460 RepID=UPI001EE0815D|nr:hypothetical protein [Dactylosporangium sp. AC04546]WVK88088.1 hypothetical protein KZZ52_22690 [Dactylosporangium sp. AC04546]
MRGATRQTRLGGGLVLLLLVALLIGVPFAVARAAHLAFAHVRADAAVQALIHADEALQDGREGRAVPAEARAAQVRHHHRHVGRKHRLMHTVGSPVHQQQPVSAMSAEGPATSAHPVLAIAAKSDKPDTRAGERPGRASLQVWRL